MVNQRRWVAKNLSGTLKKLHQQLGYHYPSYKKFFSEVDGKTELVFWWRFPSPHHSQETTEEELAKFLRVLSHNGLSTKKAVQIKELVEMDEDTKLDFQDKRDFIVRSLVQDIRNSDEERAA
uniref:hypothetical protein n=1 Tax=Cohnella fermenti TaxID=2565925 RepID=UPI001E49A3B6|nr:hypothetical protein [Cohnella fermenti]